MQRFPIKRFLAERAKSSSSFGRSSNNNISWSSSPALRAPRFPADAATGPATRFRGGFNAFRAMSTTTTTSTTDASTKNATKPSTKHEFQAETSKLLNIVSQSLYSERDVFLRELISNASDALEKFRYSVVNLGENAVKFPGRELEIRITTNPVEKTLTIEDTGIGMTKAEMMSFLGTIGKSGSQAFVKSTSSSSSSSSSSENKNELDAESASANGGTNKTIIGQFGVGFYSSFMVGEDVEVISSSSLVNPPIEVNDVNDEIGRLGETTWRSQGTESYEISR